VIVVGAGLACLQFLLIGWQQLGRIAGRAR
jgi:hypothetical protein